MRRRSRNLRARSAYVVTARGSGGKLFDKVYADNIQQAVRVAMSRWRHEGRAPNEHAVRAALLRNPRRRRRRNPSAASTRASALLAKYRGKKLSSMSEHDAREWAALMRYFETVNRSARARAAARNPRLLHIEKSAFHKGQYVGYANGVWSIHKRVGRWVATKTDEPNKFAHLAADTLQALDEKLGLLAEPQKNRRRRRSRKWDRCVAEVSARGGVRSAAAICTAALKRRKRNRRYRRSSASVIPPNRDYFTLVARKAGGHSLTYLGGNKFGRHGKPVLFRSKAGAAVKARALAAAYPILAGYTFYAKPVPRKRH